MDLFPIAQVKNTLIKKFLDETPGLDIISFDSHDRSTLAQLLEKSAEQAVARGGAKPASKGAKRAKAAIARRSRSKAALEAEIGQDVLAAVRAFQRTYRLTGETDLAEGLIALGLDSAAKIAAMSSTRFFDVTRALFKGDKALALDVYKRAGHVKTAALHLHGSVKDLAGSPYYSKARFNVASPEVIDYFTNIPSYTTLFGNMNYFETDPGQTIFSPSAYFFDAMRIVDEYITYPNTQPVRTIPPGYALEERRPDLFALKLTPANTFTEIPTLTLVNDVLAFSIQARDGQDAYQYLALAPYPFDLPFTRPLVELRKPLDVMNTPLIALYQAMATPDGDAKHVQPLDVARESLNLSVTDEQRLTKADPSVAAVTAAYGYDIPRTPAPYSGVGDVGTMINSTAVGGAGTRFTIEIGVGDTIAIGGALCKVTAIASDTQLTVDNAWAAQTARNYIVVPKATVLIMARTTPRRFFTYDTGRNETLFIELGRDFDPACESFVADRFPAVGLQIANMRIIYRSRRATGELRLNRRLEKRWLRPSREVFDVSANLRFDEPALDIAGFGEVEIDWRLTVSAPDRRSS